MQALQTFTFLQPNSSLFPPCIPEVSGTNASLWHTKVKAIDTTRKAEIFEEFIFDFLPNNVKETMNNEQRVYSADFYTVQFKCQETGVFNTLIFKRND